MNGNRFIRFIGVVLVVFCVAAACTRPPEKEDFWVHVEVGLFGGDSELLKPQPMQPFKVHASYRFPMSRESARDVVNRLKAAINTMPEGSKVSTDLIEIDARLDEWNMVEIDRLAAAAESNTPPSLWDIDGINIYGYIVDSDGNTYLDALGRPVVARASVMVEHPEDGDEDRTFVPVPIFIR